MAEGLVSSLGDAVRAAVNLLLPVHCTGCGRQGDIICRDCVRDLPQLLEPFCDVCASTGVQGTCQNCLDQSRFNTGHLLGIRSPYLMEGSVRQAIHSLKYRNVRVGAPCLGALMADYLAE